MGAVIVTAVLCTGTVIIMLALIGAAIDRAADRIVEAIYDTYEDSIINKGDWT